MSAATRRKSYPNDTFTWISLVSFVFLLSAMAVVLYRLDTDYKFLGLF